MSKLRGFTEYSSYNCSAEELLYAEVQSLNLTDVTELASQIIGAQIPAPPPDFLDFEEVKLYICPAGVHIGTTFYPQGFSFIADVLLFGVRANIECGTHIIRIPLVISLIFRSRRRGQSLTQGRCR